MPKCELTIEIKCVKNTIAVDSDQIETIQEQQPTKDTQFNNSLPLTPPREGSLGSPQVSPLESVSPGSTGQGSEVSSKQASSAKGMLFAFLKCIVSAMRTKL